MRKLISELLYDEMSKNSNIYLITADLGYGLWDDIRKTYPNNFYNVGSSEMLMMGMAIGMAMEGKIPFVYSITPFVLYRPFEMIRNYINREKTPVRILGGGRNRDYGYLGFSHWADDDIDILNSFNNIKLFKPNTNNELIENFNFSIKNNTPTYINLKK